MRNPPPAKNPNEEALGCLLVVVTLGLPFASTYWLWYHSDSWVFAALVALGDTLFFFLPSVTSHPYYGYGLLVGFFIVQAIPIGIGLAHLVRWGIKKKRLSVAVRNAKQAQEVELAQRQQAEKQRASYGTAALVSVWGTKSNRGQKIPTWLLAAVCCGATVALVCLLWSIMHARPGF